MSANGSCPKCGKPFYGKKRRCYKCVPGGRKSQITTLPVPLAPMRGPGPSAATIARVDECRRLEGVSAVEHEATVKADATVRAAEERLRVREERRDTEARIRRPVITAPKPPAPEPEVEMAATATCPPQHYGFTLPAIDPCGGPCSGGFAGPATITITDGDGAAFPADLAAQVEALAAPAKKPGDPAVVALNAAMDALAPLSQPDRARVMKCLNVLLK